MAKFYFHPTRGADNNGNNVPLTTDKEWIVIDVKCKDPFDYNKAKKALKTLGYLYDVIVSINDSLVEDEGVCQVCGRKWCDDINHFTELTCGWGKNWTLFHQDDWDNAKYNEDIY